MMRTYWIVLAAVVAKSLLVLPHEARADDAQPYPAGSSPVWSGFSVGIGSGVTTVTNGLDLEAIRGVPDHPSFGDLAIIGRASSGEDSAWSGFGTLQAGYDRVVSARFLIGAFVDFDFAGTSGVSAANDEDNPEILFTAGNPTFASGISLDGRVETENAWTVGGRIGFLAHPRLLVYGLGGYSQIEMTGQFNAFYADQFNNNVQLPAVRFGDRLSGYTVGGGSEIALYDNLSLKLEYRYSKYDGETVGATQEYQAFSVDNRDTLTAEIDDVHQHSIRGVLVFKLGH